MSAKPWAVTTLVLALCVAIVPVCLRGWASPQVPMASASRQAPRDDARGIDRAPATEARRSDVLIVSRPVKIAQLLGDWDRERSAPTSNLTETRYRLVSTDLGVPFRHAGRTYLLFGDSYRRTAQGLAVPAGDSIAFTTDSSPEDGLDLTFLTDVSGAFNPVRVSGISQGSFEVPMEGTSLGGKMYLFLTTDHSEQVTMGRSVVAVSEDDGQTFRYMYDLSRQHFINVSAVEVDTADWPGLAELSPERSGVGLAEPSPERRGVRLAEPSPERSGVGLAEPSSEGSADAILLFGSGAYRQSDVRLAFMPAEQVASGQGLRYFVGVDPAGQPVWGEREGDAVPLFQEPCVGELSATYNRFLHKWLLLYNCELNPRGIRLRTADAPWGLWSEPQVLFDPWQDGGYCHYIHASWQTRQCDQVQDPGRDDEWGGAYGPYQFEDLAVGREGESTVYFALSTWNPYTVVLMRATLRSVASRVAFLPLICQ